MLKLILRAAALVAGLAFAHPVLAQSAQNQMLAPTQSGHAAVNGVAVYYQTYGAGSPLVLLHGGLGAIEMFGPVIAQLAESHTVIGIDLQGHGRTAPFDRPMTFEAMADDVAGVFRHLGYDKADVVGYSTGGGVALRLGLDHPELVNRLVLVSTPFARAGWHQFNLDGMAQIGAASAEAMKPTPMYQMFAAVNPDPEANWPKLHQQLGELLTTEYDWSADLANGLAMPTMLVVGDWDSVRIAHAVAFFAKLGGGLVDAGWNGASMNANRLAVLPGQTHYSIFMSKALGDAVLGFLDAR